MSKEVWLGQNNLRFLYFRYKDSAYYSLSIITTIFIVSLILFFKIILPQLNNWFSIRNEVLATRARIDILKHNINYMNNLDRGILNSRLQTTLSALPPEKDFAGIITAISVSSIKSRVILDDFTFQVGTISSNSAAADFIKNNIPAIKMKVQIEGDTEGTKKFVEELAKELPLSEVINLDRQSQFTVVTIVFYNKPLPHLAFHDEESIQSLSENKINLLDTITSWHDQQTPQGAVPSQNGSASAVPLF